MASEHPLRSRWASLSLVAVWLFSTPGLAQVGTPDTARPADAPVQAPSVAGALPAGPQGSATEARPADGDPGPDAPAALEQGRAEEPSTAGLSLDARPASARQDLADDAPQRPDFKPWAVPVAVVPGLLFHGLAPLVAGDTHTAKRLFALEGTGLGLIALGGVPIVLTGASRRTIAPLYAVTLAGFSALGISALANLYAVTSPAFDPGVAPPMLPPLELELGYQHVNDTAFDYRHFVTVGAQARFESLRLLGTVRVDPAEGNTQVRLGGAWRLLGAPERSLVGTDGSALDVEAFGQFHRYPTEGFAMVSGEVGLRGRLAMSRISPALAGSFAEVSLGTSLETYTYAGAVSDGNLHDQLLYTFGYGVWLGRGGGPFRGEAMLYYDHRKDSFVGGLRSRGGGIVGAFGLRGRALLTESWGVAAEVQAGGALVGRLSLIYALGGER
ncbi:hypothetical protein [Comamonas sp. JC664]|uniref:hypothetical protein n=1 Tax=Comamonas sp. JC664 TaxID=2801917 RepID=UPI00191D541E|nr:hypothetical protein [Comamonas sp. JC664]MBL0698410.1 hypothetical protein [Comamonas sp. JC664]GHG90109.1 hypothetical protein GCM10012319_50030 [Comamonas sp. KCTC 72670]